MSIINKMPAYYNEIDKYPAQWMRNLIDAGHIAPGYVDNRSINDVVPNDLSTYNQCHFFAGIGVWSHALRLAGWPDDRPVWTGSCPCQPFSTAGKRGGTDDPRHLWPDWFRLIRKRRPPVIFGEQVASKDGLAWIDLVYTDLESAGYAVAAADLCAASVGAPHIRQRLYFMAESNDNGFYTAKPPTGNDLGGNRKPDAANTSGRSSKTRNRQIKHSIMADANSRRREQLDTEKRTISELDTDSILANPKNTNGRRTIGTDNGWRGSQEIRGSSPWDNIEWLPCRDGKARPTKPGLFPLVNGTTARVGRLRAYGNAIVAPLAAEFIRSCMDILE